MKSKNKNLLLLFLLVMILGIVAGYAALNQVLTIDGTANITGDWNIKITKMVVSDAKGKGPYFLQQATYPGNGTVSASISPRLEYPGAYAVHDIYIKNWGTIPAKLISIEGLNEANSKIPYELYFTFDGEIGDTLAPGEEKIYHLTCIFDENATEIPYTNNKRIELKLTYEQDT